jgi:sulfite exporter TauE/SafE
MILAAFILGFTGSLHCIGMCGPIAVMVSGNGNRSLLLNRLLYNTGRIATYVLMGVVVGMLGKIVQWGGVQGKVSIGVGLLIILVVLIPKIQSIFIPSLSKFVVRLKALFGRHIRSQSPQSAVYTGLLNGFLPCGLVYAGLAIALVQANGWGSALVMAVFGLGTVPALLASAYSWQAIRQRIPWSFQKIQTVMLVIVAAVMVWRGINAETHIFHAHGPDVICTPDSDQ